MKANTGVPVEATPISQVYSLPGSDPVSAYNSWTEYTLSSEMTPSQQVTRGTMGTR